MNLTTSEQTVVRQSKGFALAAILLFCVVNLHFGLRQANPALTAAGAIGLCYVMLRGACQRRGRKAWQSQCRPPARRRIARRRSWHKSGTRPSFAAA